MLNHDSMSLQYSQTQYDVRPQLAAQAVFDTLQVCFLKILNFRMFSLV